MTHVIMVVFPGLKPFHIIQFGVVETNGIAVTEESVARAVVCILTLLVHM